MKLAISNKNWHLSDEFQKTKINNTFEFSCDFFFVKTWRVLFEKRKLVTIFERRFSTFKLSDKEVHN